MGGKETGNSESANKLLSKEESSTVFNTVFTMSVDPHRLLGRVESLSLTPLVCSRCPAPSLCATKNA